MTDEKVRTPRVRKTPPGTVRPLNFGTTLAIMVGAELYNAITVTADENGVSKAEVARDWLEVGRKKGGAFIDES